MLFDSRQAPSSRGVDIRGASTLYGWTANGHEGMYTDAPANWQLRVARVLKLQVTGWLNAPRPPIIATTGARRPDGTSRTRTA
jgi:hypothetical protein